MSNPGPSLRGAVDLSGLVRRANTPTPAPGTTPPPSGSGLVVEVTEATFPQIVELSARVPVVVELYAPGLAPALGAIVESYGGRLVLATVDAQANPGIAEAFQVREVPAAAGIIGGRPVPLFVGTPADEQVRQVFDQLLQVAQQNGITGSLDPNAAPSAEDDSAEPAAPVEEPLPPLHQEAFDAISTGDYAAAVAAYKKAIVQNPRDTLAVAGLAQASLLQRLDGAVADDLRKAAADAPASVAAQLAVADLDVSGGHLDDAFARLLDLFPSLDGEGREAVRTRLLEYFEIAGADDPRVAAARRRLTLLLY
ncbi:tetratricopeptide repeat protein [Pseudolysinimonas yzui]|uniref:Thioredoxin n=1 Tax=Pseudolysinimonas yzui TaxID=2708254 RepID=A0A8J3LXP9_9MICO|nr:tetratricopeptide repeat protein [Pseudolysinimonas yzui]GHF06386.1 thioredoxin [Pseudolysinimonas yzui]